MVTESFVSDEDKMISCFHRSTSYCLPILVCTMGEEDRKGLKSPHVVRRKIGLMVNWTALFATQRRTSAQTTVRPSGSCRACLIASWICLERGLVTRRLRLLLEAPAPDLASPLMVDNIQSRISRFLENVEKRTKSTTDWGHCLACILFPQDR